MNIAEFKRSLNNDVPPKEISSLLLSLWYDAKGDWESSHKIAQEINSKEGALIHAYLHRKEGDMYNAEYWYRRSNKKKPGVTLEEEWQLMVKALCTE